METPDYVYQSWLQDAYEGSSKKGGTQKRILEELVEMNTKMDRLIELLSLQGRIRPG